MINFGCVKFKGNVKEIKHYAIYWTTKKGIAMKSDVYVMESGRMLIPSHFKFIENGYYQINNSKIGNAEKRSLIEDQLKQYVKNEIAA